MALSLHYQICSFRNLARAKCSTPKLMTLHILVGAIVFLKDMGHPPIVLPFG